MNSFNFWQKWLLITSIFLITFGFGLAFFNHTGFFNQIFNDQINPAFWGHTQIDGTITHFQGWIYGVLGATVAGWGVMMLFLILYPFKARERWAWSAAAFNIGLWFVVDTAVSLAYGVLYNAAFNILLLIVFTLPLIFTRKYFTGK